MKILKELNKVKLEKKIEVVGKGRNAKWKKLY